jgi:hypothetical protein
MLQVIPATGANLPAGAPLWVDGGVMFGLREDTDYLITPIDPHTGERLFIDDVELPRAGDGTYRWRPSFYAGRVAAELVGASGTRRHCWLDVGPSLSKSGDECFAEMVAQIRAFNPVLLGGQSAAAMAFGRDGRAGLFTEDLALSRLRNYGPAFADALLALSMVPHRSIAADSVLLPLSSIRRLHHSAMRDRRIAAISIGKASSELDVDSIQLRSLTSAPTFDTPANQTLLALARRLFATIARLHDQVLALALAGDGDEQAARAPRRVGELAILAERVRSLTTKAPFSEVKNAKTTAAGLTQIAAHPMYSRAYRLGCLALATGVEGTENQDMLHVSHSWGIYETWCYLAVLQVVTETFGVTALACAPAAVSAQLAHRCNLADGRQLELYFQALFPSGEPASASRLGWSISRERRPDIVLVLRTGDTCRGMVLDAKWRSGRDNVLQAMESAHIYHDALRLAGRCPSPCVLLLPGPSTVPSLEKFDYIATHEVGALSEVSVAAPGLGALAALLANWAQLPIGPAAPPS